MAQERQQPLDVRVAETTRNVGAVVAIGGVVAVVTFGVGAAFAFAGGAFAVGAEIYRGRHAKPTTA